jgi:hypothetical protein
LLVLQQKDLEGGGGGHGSYFTWSASSASLASA